MNNRLRTFLKSYAYPLFLALTRKVTAGTHFSGNYAAWEDAVRRSQGYGSNIILERVTQAALQVKQGTAVYERDSVLFDKIQYSWPLLAGLLWTATQKGNCLNIADFGGSLGTSYFQTRSFLAGLDACRWSIIEQKRFVDIGKRHFEDACLHFYESLDDCMANEKPDALLLSSVLPYVPQPYALLDDIIRRGFEFILVDRTPFFLKKPDRLTVQKVPDWIYAASFPAWLLNRDRFLETMSGAYELIADFDSPETANLAVCFKGFIFRKKMLPADPGSRNGRQ